MTLANALAEINSAAAVRERAHEMLALADAQQTQHFELLRAQLPAAINMVARTTRERYPDLQIPFHSRWRHFEVDGVSRFAAPRERHFAGDALAKARSSIDLAVVSVLLDAGAGADWHYVDGHGQTHQRSEGLAIASLEAFLHGSFSTEHACPLQADAQGLANATTEDVAKVFQVSTANPMLGLPGRAGLLRALAGALHARPDYFGESCPRPGHLVDFWLRDNPTRTIAAPRVLAAVLDAFGSIWPGRERLHDAAHGDVALGDVWRHPQIRRSDLTDQLVPFHKLSQWLTYSLLEPLQACGFTITELDGLTGLAEYRNGGLLVDAGVLVPHENAAFKIRHEPSAALIVEWRALTVALLDEIAVGVREEMGLDATSLPLASVLEGGTWATGRRMAAARRQDSGPPLQIVSDGTVF